MGFLVGFLSQSDPKVAYVHFVGVDPSLRRHGVAAGLYDRFFRLAVGRGVTRVDCITSPGNWVSLAFHTGLGFRVAPGDTTIEEVAVQFDYDGPGLHRITFTRPLPASTSPDRTATDLGRADRTSPEWTSPGRVLVPSPAAGRDVRPGQSPRAGTGTR